MKHNLCYIGAFLLSSFLCSCSGNKSSSPAAADSSSQPAVTSSEAKAATTPQQANTNAADDPAANSAQPMPDTGKLNSDLNDLISSISGKPDTTKLKNDVSDILSTDADMLSDSEIDKLYGNSNDPSVIAAKNEMKKMRNSTGLTPAKLDSMKKAAAQLRDNGIAPH